MDKYDLAFRSRWFAEMAEGNNWVSLCHCSGGLSGPERCTCEVRSNGDPARVCVWYVDTGDLLWFGGYGLRYCHGAQSYQIYDLSYRGSLNAYIGVYAAKDVLWPFGYAGHVAGWYDLSKEFCKTPTLFMSTTSLTVIKMLRHERKRFKNGGVLWSL